MIPGRVALILDRFWCESLFQFVDCAFHCFDQSISSHGHVDRLPHGDIVAALCDAIVDFVNAGIGRPFGQVQATDEPFVFVHSHLFSPVCFLCQCVIRAGAALVRKTEAAARH